MAEETTGVMEKAPKPPKKKGAVAEKPVPAPPKKKDATKVKEAAPVAVKTPAPKREPKVVEPLVRKEKSFYRKYRIAASNLKMLSDGTRLAILDLLNNGEEFVGTICEHVGQSQPAVSHHLALLRNANYVESNPEGKNRSYSLTKGGKKVIEFASDYFGSIDDDEDEED